MKNVLLLFLPLVMAVTGCQRQFGDYYDPPEGMEEHIYLQLAADPELSTFVSAIDRLPALHLELNTSGLFTIVAPNNEAFRKYFENHETYKSLEDIPDEVLEPTIKYHIMRWMIFQAQFEDSEFFKFETRSTVPFTETAPTGAKKSIFYTSKMLQIYTTPYLDRNNVTASDYSDVYGEVATLSTTTKMNVMGASVLKSDISAGNGVCYVIDRVLDPPLNIAQHLDTNENYEIYNNLLKNKFLTYTYDRAGTLAQGNRGDVDGDGMIDSLWTRSYTTNPYLDLENPKYTSRGVTTYYTISAFIPSKHVFDSYLETRLVTKFGSVEAIPANTLSLLFRGHLTNSLNWPSQIDKKLITNLLGDNMDVSRGDINSMQMLSNGLFYELNKVVEPKAFTTVTGPAFFAPEYTYFATMLVNSGLLPVLSNVNTEYTIFAPTNEAFNKYGIEWLDNPTSGKPGFFRIKEGQNPAAMDLTELNRIMGNHIILFDGLSTSDFDDGFYRTQNDSFIVMEDDKFFGSERDSIPDLIDPNHEMLNGYFHGIDDMIDYPRSAIYARINSATAPDAEEPFLAQYYKFKQLCSAAGILTTNFTDITATSTGKKFTLFCPSNEVITAAQEGGHLPTPPPTGGLTAEEKARLVNYIKYFFVQDQQIVTDGKVVGRFSTKSLSPESTELKDVFYTATVSWDDGSLMFTNINNETAKVDISQSDVLQNMICLDGVIHVIDNAFTSLYNN